VLGLRDEAALRCDLALACRERGELAEALRLLEQALYLMELAGDARLIADIHNDIGAIHARRRDRTAARQSFEAALAVLGDDVTPEAAESHYELARLELEEGRAPQAFEQAQVALRMANRLRSEVEEGQSCLVMAQALLSLSRPGEAVLYLRRARDVSAGYGLEQSRVATELLRHTESGLRA
jgi:tetratricopeptide (TPR) repeat protein